MLLFKDKLLSLFKAFRKNHGFWSLYITIFLLSFPTAMPLWAMSFFLLSGLIYWTLDFNKLILDFRKDIYFVAGPVLYSLLNLLWAVIQRPPVSYYSDSFIFMLVPILGYPVFKSIVLAENFTRLIKIFILGLIIVCIFDFARAFVNSISITGAHFSFNPNLDPSHSNSSIDILSSVSRFRSLELSRFEHPTYLSLKVLFAICLVIWLRNELNYSKLKAAVYVLLLTVFLFSLSSRATFIAVAILVIERFYVFFSRRKIVIVWILMLPLVFYFSFKLAMMNTRIRQKTEVFITNFNRNRTQLEKADPRILAWTNSLELIRKRPLFGYGLYSRDYLADTYKRKGYDYAAYVKLNPHNQFLESQLAFGLAGSIVLIYTLLVPFGRKMTAKIKQLYVIFLTTLVCFLLFASMLNGIWGIVFFILFYCMMILPDSDKVNLVFDSKFPG